MTQPEQLIDQLIEDGKVQEAMIAITILRLAEIYAPNGWDQPAGLWTVRRKFPPEEALEQLRALMPFPEGVRKEATLQGMTLYPLKTPPVRDGREAVGLLHYLRDNVHRAGGSDEQDSEYGQFVGWAFVNEAWSVQDLTAEQVRAIEQGEAPRAREHPDRREARVILVVDRAQVRYQLTVIRDGDTFLAVDFDGQDVGGSVIDALAEVMEATP